MLPVFLYVTLGPLLGPCCEIVFKLMTSSDSSLLASLSDPVESDYPTFPLVPLG